VDAPYVAFVVRKTKAQKTFESLHAKGVSSERLSRVKAPAGLDIGAVSPEEIAVSILAEIVQVGRNQPQPTLAAKTTSPPGERPSMRHGGGSGAQSTNREFNEW